MYIGGKGIQLLCFDLYSSSRQVEKTWRSALRSALRSAVHNANLAARGFQNDEKLYRFLEAQEIKTVEKLVTSFS